MNIYPCALRCVAFFSFFLFPCASNEEGTNGMVTYPKYPEWKGDCRAGGGVSFFRTSPSLHLITLVYLPLNNAVSVWLCDGLFSSSRCACDMNSFLPPTYRYSTSPLLDIVWSNLYTQPLSLVKCQVGHMSQSLVIASVFLSSPFSQHILPSIRPSMMKVWQAVKSQPALYREHACECECVVKEGWSTVQRKDRPTEPSNRKWPRAK